MQGSPPRRSRRPPPSDSGSSFPLIPIVLATIVIGFVIGAGLSMAGKHGVASVAVATAAPTLEPTLAPATLAPTEVPTREPTEEPATASPPTQKPATRAPATHAPATHAPATQAPAAQASAAQPSATQAPAAQGAAAPSPASHASAMPSATAHVVAKPNVAAAAPTDAPAAGDDADTDFGRLAASVVRGYIGAVARGDSASAASSLANSSDRVTESSVLDATTRIKHVEARGTADAATVNVDFTTAAGPYFGQYTVRRTSTGTAVIVAHTIIKP